MKLSGHTLAPIVKARAREGFPPVACVFAKPPRAGEAKTRLAAEVGARQAAAFAAAFLTDTFASLRASAMQLVLATTERWSLARELGPDRALLDGAVLRDTWVWLQGDGDLGARLERMLRRALEVGPWALAVGADAPGFPAGALAHAERALSEADVVFGPARDGGFYLVALRRCPQRCFEGIPWSSSQTLEALERRMGEMGLRTARVQPWFDVDTLADLRDLERLIAEGHVSAPATTRALGRWRPRTAPHRALR